MSLFKLSRQRIIIGLTITLTAIASLVNASEGKAQSRQPIDDISRTIKVSFNPPPVADNGAPGGRRKGAGSHSLCKFTKQATEITPLIALMPEIPIETETKSKTYVWGKTAVDHPNFWFYVAYPANTYAEFVLQDEAENEIYQTTFTLNKTSGIVSLTLPKDKITLEIDKSYHWYFNIMCDSEDTTDDFVEGWIERVRLNPFINNQLESVQPIERISIYAENGLWYDTLTNLDRLRQIEPENKAIANLWSDLLQQVGLDEISQKPIVKRYNLEN
ncbi:DUF928 domain-containing protein [Pleurocapsa sp. PCC 7319]|uniref:DUF928 domain-containing protein n=1 Tax=Pleurocapsa sp. PCC 7319 TaxID=118161 RepID=UPI00034D3520|nr:DUF928 domain-containing protein [Pleurocapsa sp. PCC 7319]